MFGLTLKLELLSWFESKNKSELYLSHGFDEFAFKMSFRQHFGVSSDNLKMEDWIALKRDKKINNLIK